MLDPEYLLRVSEGGEEIAEALHSDILSKIIERIALRLDRGDSYILTAQDRWQLEVLQESGLLLEDVQKILAKSTGLMQDEIAEAMEDAGVKALEYDDAIYKAAGLSPVPLTESPHLIRLMQRTYEATLGDWKNFTGTMADTAQQTFIKACDKAYTQAASGAVSYSQAFVEAVNDIVSDGVRVTYPSGHEDTIETATLRCIRTGISQATAQITDARMDEMGWDVVLTSAHVGARPGNGGANGTNHIWWQGRFFSRTGKTKKFPLFGESTGYGTVTGLCGANCRHSYGPGDGVNNPFDAKDINYADQRKEYELQQRQRTLERRIRKTKQEVMGYRTALDNATTDESKAILESEYQKKSALLQRQNKAYKDFCDENDLKQLRERVAIAKWDRSQAAKARAAAKKRINEVGEAAAATNWHAIPVAGGQTETKYRRIVEPKDIDQNVALTNPGYKFGGPGYRQNCQRCVAAYEMRRRGYDVIAQPAVVGDDGKLSVRDPLYTTWKSIFKGAKFEIHPGFDGGKSSIISQMDNWGDGAVAEVRVLWNASEGHVFIAERINGVVRFVDPQNGSINCEQYFTNAALGATMIARIDNLEPSPLIEKCIKNRGGKR